jgi:16S rRNA (cytidine1402-2'-O)-methyltransferase
LTKVYEEVFRGTVSQAIAHFSQPRGEFTLVIAGCSRGRSQEDLTDYFIKEEFRRLRREGVTAKDAVAKLTAVTHLPKKVLYKAWLELD